MSIEKKKHPQQKKKGDNKQFESKPSKGQKKTMYLQPLNFQKSSDSPDNKGLNDIEKKKKMKAYFFSLKKKRMIRVN